MYRLTEEDLKELLYKAAAFEAIMTACPEFDVSAAIVDALNGTGYNSIEQIIDNELIPTFIKE